MTRLTLDEANRIASAALAKGQELALKPLCVAILDAGGCLIALQRQDQSSSLRPQLAIGKASGALDLGMSSRKIADMASERPTFVASLGGIARQGLIPAAGGVIITRGGEVVGAVGITGDTSDNDEVCALAGIAAVGLQALG